MKRVLLAVTAVSFPVACQMPASVLLFWCTNNLFSMVYTGALQTAAVKAALGIAQMPTKESTKVTSTPPSRPQTPPAPPPPTPTHPHPPHRTFHPSQVHPHFRAFRWTRANSHFCHGGADCIALGGGPRASATSGQANEID